ncbi:MAG: hypothetical protein KDN20_11210 [Verrucomicrobiae bacterium]|nr:hypothetical protein [Verrucomicrobiae bacterium]
MKTGSFRKIGARGKGFTLMEMTLALTMAMGVAAAVVVLMQQQVTFQRILNRFSFLRDEAPSISLLVSNIVKEADSYRIFTSKSSAFSGSGAVNTGGNALWLRYRNPDGSIRQAAMVFETVSGESELNFYNHTGVAWPTSADWTISSLPTNVTFSNNSGVLLVTVTGPEAEEITYVGDSE